MSRVTVVDPATAGPEVAPMLAAVKASLGGVPNFIRVLANSPTALEGFLGLYSIAGKGVLDPHVRERIALAVAEQNGCQYCVSAHTAISGKLGLEPTEIRAAREGAASEPKAAAAVTYALALVNSMGGVSNAEFEAARAVLSEEEIVEIIAHVALNIFTNILGKSTRVPIDFPETPLLNAA